MVLPLKKKCTKKGISGSINVEKESAEKKNVSEDFEQNCRIPELPLSEHLANPRTNAPTGRVDRNWTRSGGKAP